MKRASGFTLIELMVTLAVAAILVSIAMPAFDQMVKNNRRVAATNDFLASLHQARSEAITRARRITLCPTTNGSSCANNPDGWETGWLVFVDVDGNGAVDAGDEILGTTDALRGGLKLLSSDFPSSITYTTNGRLVGDDNGELLLCDADASVASRVIIIDRTGRPRTSDKDMTGGDPSCTT